MPAKVVGSPGMTVSVPSSEGASIIIFIAH